jgi:hypothetical protein
MGAARRVLKTPASVAETPQTKKESRVVNKKIFGAVMSIGALVAGCTNNAPPAYYPYYSTPEDPNDVNVVAPAPAPEPPPPPPAPVHQIVTENQNDRTELFEKVDTGVQQEDPNLYPQLADIIKTSMPYETRGSAMAVRFVNVENGLRVSAGLTSDEGFTTTGVPGQSMAIMTSDSGESIAILATWMRPGHFECGDTFSMEFAPAGVLAIEGAAAWSDNPGGSCEVDIYAGDNPGDLQGKITGTLVSNDASTKYTLESGYFYARRQFVANPSAPPAPRRPNFTH